MLSRIFGGLFLLAALPLFAQPEPTPARAGGPVFTVRLDLPMLGLPFYHVRHHARNVGVALGVEVPYNRRGTLVQNLQFGVLRFAEQGTHAYVQTQFGLRPTIGRHLELGLDLGLGYMLATGPSAGWQRGADGGWQRVRNRNGLWFAPVQARIGYRGLRAGNVELAPFAGYGVQVLSGYNNSFSVAPAPFFFIGNNFKFHH